MSAAPVMFAAPAHIMPQVIASPSLSAVSAGQSRALPYAVFILPGTVDYFTLGRVGTIRIFSRTTYPALLYHIIFDIFLQ